MSVLLWLLGVGLKIIIPTRIVARVVGKILAKVVVRHIQITMGTQPFAVLVLVPAGSIVGRMEIV